MSRVLKNCMRIDGQIASVDELNLLNNPEAVLKLVDLSSFVIAFVRLSA